MTRDLADAPAHAPMRPHGKPRRMRAPGRRRPAYIPMPKQTCPHGRQTAVTWLAAASELPILMQETP